MWTGDITYIQIDRCNYYLCVVMDWDSRFVPGCSMGRHMEVRLWLDALDMALKSGRCPKIFNTGQGRQYTSGDCKEAILEKGIKISMDCKGQYHYGAFLANLQACPERLRAKMIRLK